MLQGHTGSHAQVETAALAAGHAPGRTHPEHGRVIGSARSRHTPPRPRPHPATLSQPCLRPAPGAQLPTEEGQAFCRGRITHFKIPRHIRFVEEFPRTSTGKVQKFRMREQMAAELAGETNT